MPTHPFLCNMEGYIYLIATLTCAFIILILIMMFLKWTIGRFESDIKMDGKLVIVTGANTGIGFYTAKDLAARGARVILACRNEEKGTTAQNKIIQETGNKNVLYKNLNLSDLSSVRKFAQDIIDSENRLDVLINNAGIYGVANRYTHDGILEGMQVNYFAPFLLTLLLVPLLKKSQPSRIINVNSVLHFVGFYDTKKLNEKGYYGKIRSYSISKLCNLIFTVELGKRLQGTGVVANAVHPGIIKTDLVENSNLFDRLGFRIWCWVCYRSPEDGAQTSLYLAAAEETAQVSGKYFVDCKARFKLRTAGNQEMARDLWKLSESLVGFKSDL